MKVTSHEQPFPYLEFEDYLTAEELLAVRRELDVFRLARAMRQAEVTGSARTLDGDILKKNLGIFIDPQYSERSQSPILCATDKLFSDPAVLNGVRANKSWIFGDAFFRTNRHGTLATYYEDSDYYKPHSDAAVYTFVLWLYDEPKAFSGGDLRFPEYGITASMGNNNAIIFPSIIQHEVTKVIMQEEKLGAGLGRYAISSFIDNMKCV